MRPPTDRRHPAYTLTFRRLVYQPLYTGKYYLTYHYVIWPSMHCRCYSIAAYIALLYLKRFDRLIDYSIVQRRLHGVATYALFTLTVADMRTDKPALVLATFSTSPFVSCDRVADINLCRSDFLAEKSDRQKCLSVGA